MSEIKRKGEVWEIKDVRKGELTIRLEEDVDQTVDTFFAAELLEGKPQYISVDLNLLPKPREGDLMSFRTTLVQFLRLIPASQLDEVLQNGS